MVLTAGGRVLVLFTPLQDFGAEEGRGGCLLRSGLILQILLFQNFTVLASIHDLVVHASYESVTVDSVAGA